MWVSLVQKEENSNTLQFNPETRHKIARELLDVCEFILVLKKDISANVIWSH